MLKEGMKAPEFSLQDQNKNMVTLSNFKGQKIVVYFYPKDATPGCTAQACSFRDAYEDYKTLNVPIIGISMDSSSSHANFASKQELQFHLLADTEGKAIKDYDVWQLKVKDGNEYMGIVRTTYLINENGIIEKVYDKVNPEENAKEILEYLNNIK